MNKTLDDVKIIADSILREHISTKYWSTLEIESNKDWTLIIYKPLPIIKDTNVQVCIIIVDYKELSDTITITAMYSNDNFHVASYITQKLNDFINS